MEDGEIEIIGGMIIDKTTKLTRTNTMMAFLTVEDLVGTVEVVVFPKDYETNSALLSEDSKVFIQGRVSGEEEKASKLICEKIYSFDYLNKKADLLHLDRIDAPNLNLDYFVFVFLLHLLLSLIFLHS